MTLEQIANHATLTYLARFHETSAVRDDSMADAIRKHALRMQKSGRHANDPKVANGYKVISDRHLKSGRILRSKAACHRMKARHLRLKASAL